MNTSLSPFASENLISRDGTPAVESQEKLDGKTARLRATKSEMKFYENERRKHDCPSQEKIGVDLSYGNRVSQGFLQPRGSLISVKKCIQTDGPVNVSIVIPEFGIEPQSRVLLVVLFLFYLLYCTVL